jgi:hypothetical protein
MKQLVAWPMPSGSFALYRKHRKPADMNFNLNSAGKVVKISEHVLAARIARSKSDYISALGQLRQAVALGDTLAYDEPQTWFVPVRVWLGGAFMNAGDYAAAEQVFRADLERNKRNGRSLFGLMEALRAQKKDYAA